MKKVLIADDSNFMRAVVKNVLTKHGYIVVGEAENGRMAVEKFKELSPDFVTMDITMNIMTGIEALQDIVNYDKNAKVIMLSSMGQEHFVKEAIKLGAKGFILKPPDERKILAAIEGIS